MLYILIPAATRIHPRLHDFLFGRYDEDEPFIEQKGFLQFLREEIEIDSVVFTEWGVSDVGRARQQVASKLAHYLEREGKTKSRGLVWWLDSDNVPTFFDAVAHLVATWSADAPVAACYVQRLASWRLAASAVKTELETKVSPFCPHVTLTPVLAGMGGLMLPVWMFLEHLKGSPSNTADGEEVWLVAYPRQEEAPPWGTVYVGEDFTYCEGLPDGHVYYAHILPTISSEVFDFEEEMQVRLQRLTGYLDAAWPVTRDIFGRNQDAAPYCVSYGHVCESVVRPAQLPLTIDPRALEGARAAAKVEWVAVYESEEEEAPPTQKSPE